MRFMILLKKSNLLSVALFILLKAYFVTFSASSDSFLDASPPF